MLQRGRQAPCNSCYASFPLNWAGGAGSLSPGREMHAPCSAAGFHRTSVTLVQPRLTANAPCAGALWNLANSRHRLTTMAIFMQHHPSKQPRKGQSSQSQSL